MNRRKAIGRFLLLGGGVLFSYTGIKTYSLFRQPDLSSLKNLLPLIDELAETIIPATDTPGAKEAGVGAFIIKMISDCTDRPSQNKFMSGLSELASYSDRHFNKPFEKCSPQEKTAILDHFEKQGEPRPGLLGKAEHRFLGDSFFITLKKYTVLGYCTSELGATRALSYDYIPGKFAATVLLPGQKAWATQ